MLVESSSIEICSDSPSDIIDDIEVFTDHNVERETCWFGEVEWLGGSPPIGGVIMMKLIDCTRLSFECIQRVLNIQIFFKGFLYKFQEFRIITETGNKQFNSTVYLTLIFGQQSRMM